MPKFKEVSLSYMKIILAIAWVFFIAFLVVLSLIVRWYNVNTIRPLDVQKTDAQVFTVPKGSTWDETADKLEEEGLIRDSRALKWYIRLNNVENVHAGSFEISPSHSAREIVDILTSVVEANVEITIYPEHNLRELRDSLVDQGFSLRDAQAALDIQNYSDHYLVKEIIPAGPHASLEGYIMPETFAVNQFNRESAQDVIRQSLDIFVENLTSEIEGRLSKNFRSVHEGVILASIVELEAEPIYRAKVAQVFIKRLKEGETLGSDVTFIYVAKVEGRQPDVNDPSPYNTRVHAGLPPGPISNVTRDSLLAVANPAATTYSFFLIGDDDQMYFNYTYEEHLADIQKYCQIKCRTPRLEAPD